MARLIPDRLVPSLPLGIAKLFQHCRTLPDSWVVWQNFEEDQSKPDLLLFHETSGRAYIVRCARADKREILSGHGLSEDLDSLEQFGTGMLYAPLVGKLLFHPEIDALPDESIVSKRWIRFVGSGLLRQDLETFLASMDALQLKPDWFNELRMTFAPEGRLENRHVVNEFEANEAAQEVIFMDFRQEFLTKRDMELSDQAKSLVTDFQVRLLSGVAGSGKTLVLLHRAVMLSQRFPKSKTLVLTFNKPLRAELQRRLQDMGRGSGELKCMNFHAWCSRCWTNQGSYTPLSEKDKMSVIAESASQHFGKESKLTGHAHLELDWIHAMGIRSWEEYRDASRKGQRFRLTKLQRELMWDLCLGWRQYLEMNQLGDYPHFIYRFLVALRDGAIPQPEQWDHILIDEAQFFAPTWFEIIRKHLKPQGSLFLSADASQGFLKNGMSWNSVGFEVRGRTDRLERSYRTTRPILELAWNFLKGRAVLDAEESVVPDFGSMRPGASPHFLTAIDLQDQVNLCARSIAERIRMGAAARSFLVLVEGPHTSPTAQLLERRLNLPVAWAGDAGTDAIRLCSLEAATGLEAPFVYVLGASALLEKELNPYLDDEERSELRDRNARKLYMAFTRAGIQLHIGWCGKIPEDLQPGTAA